MCVVYNRENSRLRLQHKYESVKLPRNICARQRCCWGPVDESPAKKTTILSLFHYMVFVYFTGVECL